MEIENFDVILSSAMTGYVLRVTESSQGRTDQPAAIAWQKGDDQLLRYHDIIVPLSLEALDANIVLETVGGAIYQSLVNDQSVRMLLDGALGQPDVRVRLRVQIEPQELRRLPLELMYREPDGFFSLSSLLSVTRYIAVVGQPVRTLLAQPPLNILIASASPQGFPPLDVEGEIARIDSALADAVKDGLIRVSRCPNATLDGLRSMAREHQAHVLHFIGHGDYNEDRPVLALTRADGKPDFVDAERFALNLSGLDHLRLVVLNACDSGVESTTKPLVGLAPKLIARAGVPAVLAMQTRILDRSSAAFAQGFFAALATGGEIDVAVREGRLAVFNLHANDTRHRREFAVPVLFLRAADARLIDFPARQRERIIAGMQTGDTHYGKPLVDLYTRMANWKDVHDALHELDSAFELVTAGLDRQPSSDNAALQPAWRLSQTAIEKLRGLATDPESAIVSVPLVENADGTVTGEPWMVDILVAARRFEGALAAMQPDTLRDSARTLRRVLHTHLNITDKAITDLLPQILQTAQLDGAAGEFHTLHRHLAQRVKVHDLLQDLTFAFRRVRDESRGDPALWDLGDIDMAWEYCRTAVLDSTVWPYAIAEGLLITADERFTGAAWAVELFTGARRVDEALARGLVAASPMLVSDSVRAFDQMLSRHFFMADKALQEITAELQTLARQMHNIMQEKSAV